MGLPSSRQLRASRESSGSDFRLVNPAHWYRGATASIQDAGFGMRDSGSGRREAGGGGRRNHRRRRDLSLPRPCHGRLRTCSPAASHRIAVRVARRTLRYVMRDAGSDTRAILQAQSPLSATDLKGESPFSHLRYGVRRRELEKKRKTYPAARGTDRAGRTAAYDVSRPSRLRGCCSSRTSPTVDGRMRARRRLTQGTVLLGPGRDGAAKVPVLSTYSYVAVPSCRPRRAGRRTRRRARATVPLREDRERRGACSVCAGVDVDKGWVGRCLRGQRSLFCSPRPTPLTSHFSSLAAGLVPLVAVHPHPAVH